MKATNEAIGALVREWRQKRKLGQPELADMIGVSAMMIQHYETGRSALSVVKLVQIAEALRCKTKDLIP